VRSPAKCGLRRSEIRRTTTPTEAIDGHDPAHPRHRVDLGRDDKSWPPVEAAFGWARKAKPVQPLTVGARADLGDATSRRIFALSHGISFHGDDPPGATGETPVAAGPRPHNKTRRTRQSRIGSVSSGYSWKRPR